MKCLMRRPARALAGMAWVLGLIVPGVALAHYPFPTGTEEREKAVRIEQALKASNQASVATLTRLLADHSPRVRTAAALGIMRLAGKGLDLKSAVAAIEGLKGSKRAFVRAASEAALILLDERPSRSDSPNWSR